METLGDLGETIDDLLEDDSVAQGDVYRQQKWLTFDAPAGSIISVTVTIRDEGSRRGELTLYGPNGDEVDSNRFDMSGVDARPWVTFDAMEDGEHRLLVDPRGDRDARLRVAVTINEG